MNKTILGLAAAGSIIAGGTATQLNQPINTNFASTPTALVTYVNGNEVDIAKNAPKVTLQEWSGQEQLGISAANTTTASAPVGLTSEVDNPIGNGQTVVMEQTSDGTGFNVDINLASKPSTNVFTYQLSGWQDMDFWYQPPLNVEWASSTCTATDCGTAHRDPNVVGSYAVYSKTHKDHVLGQTNYQTGKLFQIYRPFATDSASSTAWATLNITNGLMTVTVPQSFLDQAVYPVLVDPTFGYGSAGASTLSYVGKYGSLFTAPANGTANTISVYNDVTFIPTVATSDAGLVSGTSGGFTAVVGNSATQLLTGSLQWNNYPVSISITSGTGYYIFHEVQTQGNFAYDSDGSVYIAFSCNSPGYANWSAVPTCASIYAGYKVSSYVTYTASGGGAAPTPALMQYDY